MSEPLNLWLFNKFINIGIDPEMILKTFDKNDGRTWL